MKIFKDLAKQHCMFKLNILNIIDSNYRYLQHLVNFRIDSIVALICGKYIDNRTTIDYRSSLVMTCISHC